MGHGLERSPRVGGRVVGEPRCGRRGAGPRRPDEHLGAGPHRRVAPRQPFPGSPSPVAAASAMGRHVMSSSDRRAPTKSAGSPPLTPVTMTSVPVQIIDISVDPRRHGSVQGWELGPASVPGSNSIPMLGAWRGHTMNWVPVHAISALRSITCGGAVGEPPAVRDRVVQRGDVGVSWPPCRDPAGDEHLPAGPRRNRELGIERWRRDRTPPVPAGVDRPRRLPARLVRQTETVTRPDRNRSASPPRSRPRHVRSARARAATARSCDDDPTEMRTRSRSRSRPPRTRSRRPRSRAASPSTRWPGNTRPLVFRAGNQRHDPGCRSSHGIPTSAPTIARSSHAPGRTRRSRMRRLTNSRESRDASPTTTRPDDGARTTMHDSPPLRRRTRRSQGSRPQPRKCQYGTPSRSRPRVDRCSRSVASGLCGVVGVLADARGTIPAADATRLSVRCDPVDGRS